MFIVSPFLESEYIMRYKICNIIVEIDTISVFTMENYCKYRIDNQEKADIHIKVEEIDELNLPSEVCRYQYGHGMYVFYQDGIEYRYMLNHMTMQIDKVLVNDGKKQILKILKSTLAIPISEMALFNALGLEALFYERGRIFLHSSFIETEQGAILFTAPSQTGKSTQANLWNKYRDAAVINGDRAGIWKENGRWMAGGIPWCGTSGISENRNIPLLAIVIIKQGPVNQIEPIRFGSKIGRLMEQTTINPWNNEMYQKIQELYIELCQEVPVLSFSCRPDEDAVDVLEMELKKYYEN